jgi:creatinine amidohydrolase
VQLAELSWEEVKEYLARENRLIFPIGATEQHGRHIGLGCDYILAEEIASQTGARTRIAVAPAFAYGMSHHHMRFPGTLSLRPTTLIAALEDLFRSMYQHGFRRVLVVNGHGGNEAAISSALAIVTNELEGLRAKEFTWWTEPIILKMVDDFAGPQRGTHSSPVETAFMLGVRPEAVKLERAPRRDAPVTTSREFLSASVFVAQYPDGVMGLDPTPGTAELGRQLLAKSVEMCVEEIENWD